MSAYAEAGKQLHNFHASGAYLWFSFKRYCVGVDLTC